MLNYCKDYNELKLDLDLNLRKLKSKGYHIFIKSNPIYENLSNDKIVIKSKKDVKNRLVISIGLHGIEGYVGHASLISFFDNILATLGDETEVVIYHGINPFGMKHFRRTNENNVDLNRNFSTNKFTSENKEYENIEYFFTPKKYKTKKTANLRFYGSLTKLIAKYGVTALKEATLLGQKSLPNGVYYSGDTYQESTRYMLSEIPKILLDIEKVVWIDLHTGYGPRYQMSIINSKYEKVSTKEVIEKINYPIVLGLNADDFYDVDGDMLENIYSIKNKLKSKCDLYATCFEFGTLGDSTRKMIESLKATVFENSSHHINQSPKFIKYSNILYKEQFLPSSEKWRIKAEKDFIQAITGIINYKQI